MQKCIDSYALGPLTAKSGADADDESPRLPVCERALLRWHRIFF